MLRLLSLNLNIRQKLIVAFLMSLLSIWTLGLISYYNFAQIEDKFIIVESAYDLSNVILEIRRYEKNYFLFSRENDFKETDLFIKKADTKVKKILPDIKDKKQIKYLNDLSSELSLYRKTIDEIHVSPTKSDSRTVLLIKELRNSGQKLVQYSHKLVDYERVLILKINRRLTGNLIFTLALITVFFIFLIVYILRKVIRPLKLIEEATQSIARGEFKKTVEWRNNDEIKQVIIAFNKMVKELESRQNQLVHAQKLSSIGTLASGIAHQVNNPLNNISTSCQILMEECRSLVSEIAAKMLHNIESETFRARDIVRGLLEFSRDQEFDLSESRLHEVVERTVKLISSQMPSGVDITQQIPESIVLKMDRQRMQEVFLNLLLNAKQAIATNTGRILIVANQDVEKKLVNIFVEDSGKGIPEKIKNRIFDPFCTPKIVGDGTGLGLYIVYGIIQRHNGTIKVESLMTGGTRFVIKLPTE